MNEPRSTKSFWNAVDSLCGSCEIIIDRPKGSAHPKYPELIYPLDYGYLKGTRSSDNSGIDVWRGSNGETAVNGMLCTIDINKRDSEIKILIDCSEEEKRQILDFHNGEYMRAMLIDRG